MGNGPEKDAVSTIHATRVQASERQMLLLLSSHAPLDEIVEQLVGTIEEHCPDTLGSVLRLDAEKGRLLHGAAPSLPEAYCRAVHELPVGPCVGSCGTAAFRGVRVVVEDIATDPLWADFKDLALAHDLRACWSQPILSREGAVLGTFAMYYRRPRRPNEEDIEFLEVAAGLVAIAIENDMRERELHASRVNLRQVIDLVPHMIFAKDHQGRFLLANQAVADAYGTTVDELVGKPHVDIHTADPMEVSRMLADDLAVIESGQARHIPEEPFTDARGRVRYLQATKIPFVQSESRKRAMAGIAIDITDSKRAAQERESEDARRRQLHSVLLELAKSDQLACGDFRAFSSLAAEALADALPVERVGVWQFNKERSVLTCKDLFERTPRRHSSGTELDHDDYRRYFAALERGRVVAADDAPNHPSTSEFADSYLRPQGIGAMLDAPLRQGGQVVGVVCCEHVGPAREWADHDEEFAASVADLLALSLEAVKRRRAERAFRSAQEELLRQQWQARKQVEAELSRTRSDLVRKTRMATIGQVAASIAHELRNPLAAIQNARYLLRRFLPEGDEKLAEYLAIIDQEVRAADGIVDNLLEMSRSKDPIIESADLGVVVGNALGYVKELEGIELETSFDPDPFEVESDPRQLCQVLANLITNSAQAMEGVGRLSVEARRDVTASVIVVSDSGPGIPDELRRSVFEPLFTTKAKGTGLGLPICRQILERHGGSLELLNPTEGGARFEIRLPRRTRT